MNYALTAQQMKAVDQFSIQTVGIPSLVLMERAALAVAEAAEKMAEKRSLGKNAEILAVCGTETTVRTEWRRRVSLRDAATQSGFCLSEILCTTHRK